MQQDEVVEWVTETVLVTVVECELGKLGGVRAGNSGVHWRAGGVVWCACTALELSGARALRWTRGADLSWKVQVRRRVH